MTETPFVFATPTGGKVKCRVCERTGWGKLDPKPWEMAPWQRQCLDGHPHSCSCGRRFATLRQLAGHRNAHTQEAHTHREAL